MSTHKDRAVTRDAHPQKPHGRRAQLVWGADFSKGRDIEPKRAQRLLASEWERRWAHRLGWFALGILIGLQISGNVV
jgi:hypothetical protein